MNSTKIPSFFTKEYFVIYLLSLGIFCFSVWGTKAGMIPCILGFLLFLKNNKINKTQIVKDLYPIRWWIFVNLGILSMAFISLFFCFDILQTLKAIVFFLIIPLFIFLCFFLVFKRSDSKIQKTGLTLIFSVFILHTICTIMVFFLHGDSRSVGIGDHPIIPYTLFLLIPLALSLSLFAYSRFKFPSLILVLLSFLALYANGTRASIFSACAMIIGSFLYPKYKNKKIFTPLLLTFVFLLSIIFIEWSSHQNTRFNFKHMIAKIDTVWSYAPAEMGRFDIKCFAPQEYYCRKESGSIPDSRFNFDSNTLQRLSLNKATLIIIQKNPFIPHGYYSRFWIFNLPKNLASKNIPYVTTSEHTHIHNGLLSAFFELGMFGGILYLLLFLIPIIWSLRQRNLYGLILFSIVLGTFIMSFFDSMLSFISMKSIFYALIGMILPFIRGKNENHIQC